MNEYINNLIIGFNKFDTMLAFLISFILFYFSNKIFNYFNIFNNLIKSFLFSIFFVTIFLLILNIF